MQAKRQPLTQLLFTSRTRLGTTGVGVPLLAPAGNWKRQNGEHLQEQPMHKYAPYQNRTMRRVLAIIFVIAADCCPLPVKEEDSRGYAYMLAI